MTKFNVLLSVWILFIVLNIIVCFYQCEAHPVTEATTNNTINRLKSPGRRRLSINQPLPPPVSVGILRPIETGEGRIFFDTIGNFISTSDYFPLELNVPDTIATVGQGLNDMFSGIMGLMGQAEQVPRMLYRMLKSVVVGQN